MDSVLNFFRIMPSSYPWMFPQGVDFEKFDSAAKSGNFPVISDFSEALLYSIAFSVCRYILTYFFFEVTFLIIIGKFILSFYCQPLAKMAMKINIVHFPLNGAIESHPIVRASRGNKLLVIFIFDLILT